MIVFILANASVYSSRVLGPISKIIQPSSILSTSTIFVLASLLKASATTASIGVNNLAPATRASITKSVAIAS